MTLNDILNALNTASAGGSLDLYGTNADPSWPLTNLINAAQKFGPSPSISPITQISTQLNASNVVLTGAATLVVPHDDTYPATPIDVSVRLTASLPTADDALFVLSLSPTSAWTFATTFPYLPQTELPDGGVLAWQDSFLSPLKVTHPSLTADSVKTDPIGPIALTGTVPLTGNGLLDTLTGWLGLQPLPLAGAITMPQTAGAFPAIDLKARISGAKLNVGTLTVQDLSLWFRSQINLDPDLFGTTSLTQLSLSATMTVGAVNGVVATLSSPLLEGDSVWPLYLAFEDNKPTLSGGLLMLTGLFDGLLPSEFPVPSSLPVLDDFTFENISVGLVPPTSDHPAGGLSFVAVTLGSDKTWVPPVPFTQIQNVGTRWVLTFGGDPYAYSLDEAVIAGTVYGDVVIGGVSAQSRERFSGLRKTSDLPQLPADAETFTIQVNALIPQYVVTGQLANNDVIPLNSALTYFFGGSGPDGPFANVAITAFAFSADPTTQTYDAQATVTTDVTIPLGNASITLLNVGFWVSVTQSSVAGGVSGVFVIAGGGPEGQDDPVFMLAADYQKSTQASGWTFTGQLYPGMSVDLTKLVAEFLSTTVPDWVPHIYIDRLLVSLNTTSQTYSFAGSASVKWPAPVLGIEGGIAIAAYTDITQIASEPVTGLLGGSFQIGKVSIALETDLGAETQIYRFIATFDKLILTATTGQRTSKGASQPHQVLYARLGGVTLGSILEYLVNLAAPTIGYTLDSPWDLLNRIDLSRFQLMFDPTDNIIELTCDVGADIVVMRIDTIGVRYWRPNGKSTVELILEGDFLGKAYRGDDALSWDVIDDAPPAVPGQGPSLIDIRYLGMGQRVSFANDVFNQLDTVRGYLNELAQQMGEVKDPDVNPLTQNPGMVFAADSQWLIGFDITLIDTVDLGFLFNDPKLYGLSIALHGEKAKSLAGLDFEILYKKISDTVGMFRIELRLPDQFRHFEMGEVSVTLGIIVVEIYTNGNFMVDFGFPYNRDYTRSFAVEVFPFLGKGGFYFGLLDGTTSSRTPKITNGTFAPVIEVGLGLAVGVGKEISFGPLSGGAYLEVEAAFQGVLAWFNPSDSSASSDEYYWMQAVVAIHGRIYGQVDFVIVKASANIEAYAEASVILEAYRAALFRLDAWVRVSARLRILFVTIHFSFSAEIDVSFTVGSDQRTPWILSTNQSGNSLPGTRRQPQLRRRLQSRQHLLSVAASHETPERQVACLHAVLRGDPLYVLNWDSDLVVYTTQRGVPVTLVVCGSVSGLPAQWSGTTPPPLPDKPVYELAFVVSCADGRDKTPESGPQATPSSVRTTTSNAQATDTSDLPLDVMMEAMLRWSINALIGTAPSISAGQLDLLVEQMTMSETTDAFSWGNLSTFLSKNVVIQVSGPPSGTAPSNYSASVMPMPPVLSWIGTKLANRDFAGYNKVGSLYEWGANQYFTQFQTSGGDPGAQPTDDDPANYESMASYVFRDWCLMLARTAVQSAVDQLKTSVYSLQSALSLAQIANDLPTASVPYKVRANDTVASVASALGATTAELTFHNDGLVETLDAAQPGTILDITIGASPGEIAADNPDQPLIEGVTVDLGDVSYQVPAGASFAGIATQFGLASAASLFDGTPLALNTTVLRAGAVFPTQAANYPNPQDFKLVFAAAIFFVRFANRTDIPQGDVTAETVFQLNSAAGGVLVNWQNGLDLPADTALVMPAGYADLLVGGTASSTYTTLPGDTLARLGAAYALALDPSFADADWQSFYAAVVAANSGWTTGAVALPVLPASGGLSGITVALGESLTTLSQRTILFAAKPTDMLAWIGSQPILAPLAVITVPAVSFITASNPVDTFKGLADRYGMTIADFATVPAVANNQNLLYQTSTEQPSAITLQIYHLPAQTVDTLVSDVMAGPAPGQAAGITARQLLAGQSLPSPETDPDGHQSATGTLAPLYGLTGQQVTGPQPDTTQPTAVAAGVAVTVNAGYGDWVTLNTTGVVEAGHTLEGLRVQHPDLDRLNPGLSAPGRFAPGLMILTGDTPTLTIEFTNQQLSDMYPSTGLLLAPTNGPLAMPMSTLSPRPYGLDHEIPTQAPDGFAFAPTGTLPQVGNWSLWPFPSALCAKAQSGAATLYELVQRYTDTSRPQTSDIVLNATWASVVPFSIRRMSGYQNIYEVIGADTANRQLLLQLWQSMSAGSCGYVMYAPAPSSDDTSGIMVSQPDTAKTYIVKTNLSTETVSGTQALADIDGAAAPQDTTSPYYAAFSQLTAFCTLLWEASVVGGTGYTFAFTDIHGKGLPDSCFDSSGVVVLSLLVLDATQLSPAPAGRALLKTNNYALVAPGLNASTQSLYALSTDDTDDIDMPAYPPGNIGFTVTLPQADTSSGASAQSLLAAQFSLVSYNVADCDQTPYTPTKAAPPINPQEEDGTHQSLARKQRLARRVRAGLVEVPTTSDTVYWRYDQVLPIYRFGPTSLAPDVAGLPLAEDDPYRGPGTSGTLVPARVQMDAIDVFGNVTTPAAGSQTAGTGDTTPPGAIDYSLGYFDPLITPSSWPGTTLAYGLAQTSTDVELNVTLSSQPAVLAPNPTQASDRLSARAQLQAKKYSDIYFQLVQKDVKPQVLTTLKTAQGNPVALEVDAPQMALRYAAANYIYANALVTSATVTVDTQLAADLNGVWQTYGTGPYLVASANADTPIYAAFGAATLTTPVGVPFAEGDTPMSITKAAQAKQTQGWPAPTDATALLTDDANAKLLFLRAQAVLALPAGSIFTVPSGTPSLATLAADMHTSAALLAADIAAQTQTPPTFVNDFVFDYQGFTVTVTASINTFAQVVKAFAALGVICTAADLGSENETKTGMFAQGTVLPTLHLVAGADETLSAAAATAFGQTLSPPLTLDTLAACNVATANLFDSGALVYLGAISVTLASTEARTIAEYAAAYGTLPGLLMSANLGVALPATTTLTVPGAIAAPAHDVHASYAVTAPDTLDTIAAKFGLTAQSLGTRNAGMPYVISGGQTIAVQGANVPTVTGWSITDLWHAAQSQDAQITFEQTVDAIAGSASALQSGGLLVCPPALMPASGGDLTADAAALLYNVSAITFVQANAGTMGLIAAGASLTATGLSQPIVTKTTDTFNSIVARFADAGQALSITDILAANPTAQLIAQGASAYLPPPVSLFTAHLPLGAGPFPAPVFPLYVWLRILRPESAIPPTVDADGVVARVDAVVPAPTSEQGPDGETSQTYGAFSTAFVKALPLLRLATAKVEDETTDLWAVDFSSTGISSVGVSAPIPYQASYMPRVWAIRPLYNSLQTRMNVQIQTVNADGSLATPTDFNFQNVDPESWASRMLNDIDIFLSGPYAAALYTSATGQQQLSAVLDAKKLLAPAISRGLYPVLDLSMPAPAAAQTEAQTYVADKLATSLASTYAMAALLQYDATVASAWTKGQTDAPPARLSGATQAQTPQPSAARPYGLTGAKTDVSEAASNVAFIMTVPNVLVSSHVPVNLNYTYDEIEFDIEAVTGVEGYVSSNWASFMPSLATNPPSALSTDLGASDIPVPLRAYPPLPALQAQTETASYPITSDLSQTNLWTLGVTYAHQHAEQDEVIIGIDFNLDTGLTLRASTTPDNIVNTLAAYATAADGLWTLLPGWVDKTRAVPQATLDNAATSFATLVGNAAASWDAHWPVGSGEDQGGGDVIDETSPYQYLAQIGYEGTGLKSYTLTSIGTSGQISPSGQWPDVYYTPPGGVPLKLTYINSPTTTSAVYDFPAQPVDPVELYPMQTAQTMSLSFPGLNVGLLQNAKANLAVRRNAKLMGETGPDTNEDFVYHTADIHAENSIWPLLTWPNQRFDIGSGPQSGFAAALQTALTQILGQPGSQNITLEVNLGSELKAPTQADLDGVVTYLPVKLYPHVAFSATTAADLEAEIQLWLDDHPPASTGGEWAVSLTLYADSTQDALTIKPGRVLLYVERLIYRLA